MATKTSGKIRVRLQDGGIKVKAILRHPMETGSRKHPTTGEVLPRHFIREVVCERNGTPVLTMEWGWGIAADPYLSFRIKQGEKGDLIAIRWSDNMSETGHLEATVG
ncbi:MAG: thiosulfate oxidation carrier complex protein SoxZ [Pseudomonadota bacterium]|nr:thiosulfate oxidation carrier complex protein SoxZ [Pseudomonadota bacterium]